MATPIPWRLQADYMETCNCDFGCPCNFNGLPTGGRCEALVRYHLRSGIYGDVPLDGVELVYAASWPRAIHQGSGTLCVYISDKASAEQRKAITEIVFGRAGGSGCFAVFAPTFRYVLDPQFVPIEMTIEGKKSHFAVPGVLEAALATHTDPVSGDEQEVEINLPKGFIWKTAQAAKTAVMNILSPNMNFNHAGRNAFYSIVEYQGQ